MARYTGPRVRISRRFGVPIFGPSKYLERRNYGPGVHGPKSRRKHTDYGLGLIEKQKLRYYYGLMERQFRGVYEKRSEAPRCHRRADAADPGDPPGQRGLITSASPTPAPPPGSWSRHGHVQVNGRKVNIPSFGLKVNDVVEVKNTNVVAPVGHQEPGKRHQPRRAGLAVAEQGRLQRRRHAHSDARRDQPDCQRTGRRRILFPLNQ